MGSSGCGNISPGGFSPAILLVVVMVSVLLIVLVVVAIVIVVVMGKVVVVRVGVVRVVVVSSVIKFPLLIVVAEGLVMLNLSFQQSLSEFHSLFQCLRFGSSDIPFYAPRQTLHIPFQ